MTQGRAEQQRWRVRLLALLGGLLAAPLVLLLAQAWRHTCLPGFCIIRSAFGVECPGCGITRSAMALYSGDLAGAIRWHPAGPPLMALIALLAGYLVFALAPGGRGLGRRREARVLAGAGVLAFVLLLVGSFCRGPVGAP